MFVALGSWKRWDMGWDVLTRDFRVLRPKSRNQLVISIDATSFSAKQLERCRVKIRKQESLVDTSSIQPKIHRIFRQILAFSQLALTQNHIRTNLFAS